MSPPRAARGLTVTGPTRGGATGGCASYSAIKDMTKEQKRVGRKLEKAIKAAFKAEERYCTLSAKVRTLATDLFYLMRSEAAAEKRKSEGVE